MAKIYTPPTEIGDVPGRNRQYSAEKHKSREQRKKEEQDYMEKLKDYCTTHSSDSSAGKIIEEPVADGYAVYMVFSVKPARLIHVPIGDAWQFGWAHKWSSKDIKGLIKRQEDIEKLLA